MTARGSLAAYLGVLVATVALWWVLSASGSVEEVVLPSPSETWIALRQILAEPGTVWSTAWATLQPLVPAFFAAATFGTALGAVIGRSQLLREAYEPLCANLNTVPIIVLYPLLAGALGVGVLPKLIVGFLAAFLPIVIATVWAVRSVDETLIEAADTMGASTWERMRSVVLPSVRSSIFTGLRTGLGLATVTVIAGEFIASTDGLGHELAEMSQSYQTPQLFAWLVITLAFTATLNALMSGVEHLIQRRVER